jgi:hypothetical protein
MYYKFFPLSQLISPATNEEGMADVTFFPDDERVVRKITQGRSI